MVTLYHGTVARFERPDLSRSRRGMDFGAGFYATPSRDAAIRWASKVAYLHRGGLPVVMAFEIDEVERRLSEASFRAFQYSFHTERALDCLRLREVLS